MNEIKIIHSIEPWAIEKYGKTFNGFDGLGRKIFHVSGNNTFRPIPLAEQMSNAQLMVSAPELLAACKLVCRKLAAPEFNHITKPLRAAIHAAEGNQCYFTKT